MKHSLYLSKGKIKTIEGRTHEPVSMAAVSVIEETGERALILDGSRTVDPYFMVRQIKESGEPIDEILEKITIARAFTAYQFKDLVDRSEDKLNREDEFAMIGLIGVSPIFEDDELDDEEGKWLRSKVSRKVKNLVMKHSLYGIVVDTEPSIFKD